MQIRSGPGRPQAETDERLMQRVQGGESEAFETLFERYRSRLFGFLIRRCGDEATAEDLIQETWIRVVRARDRFDPERRFSTWLFQIANNLCRDRARRREAERRMTSGVQQAEAARPAPGDPPVAMRHEMRRRLLLLPERLREVLVLRYYEELAEKEIAAILGIPPGTVKSRLHAAVKSLREQSQGESDDVS